MTPLSNRALPPQVSQEPVRPEGELWRIQAQAGFSAAAIVAVDIFFHFFYILTIPSDLKFASRLPDSALGGSPHHQESPHPCGTQGFEMGTAHFSHHIKPLVSPTADAT